MPLTLGSLTLADGLVWAEEFQYTGIVQEVRQSLGGRPQVYSGTITGPMPITLTSLDDQGWQTIAVARELQAMAKSLGQFTLVLGSRSFPVEFRHSDQPVLQVTPLIPRTDPDDEDYCTVVIKLVCYSPP